VASGPRSGHAGLGVWVKGEPRAAATMGSSEAVRPGDDALRLAAQLVDAWPGYGRYAALRLVGRRDEALAALQAWLPVLADPGVADRFATWLFEDVVRPEVCRARSDAPAGPRLPPFVPRAVVVPHPVHAPVLAALWRGHARGDEAATMALAAWFPVDVMAARDHETDAVGAMLDEAAQTSASPALRRFAALHHLRWVAADVADLAHGRYDGDPASDLARLARADAWLAVDDAARADLVALRAQVEAWVAARPAVPSA